KRRQREIGDEPRTSENRCEVADGTACQSEGGPRLSLLSALRQAVPRGRSGTRLRTLQSQPRRGGSGRPDVRGHRSVGRAELAGGTGEGTQGQDVPGRSGQAGVDPEGGRPTATVGHTDDP